MDYLVIMRMRDPKDPEAQRRRAELRPAHLERASSFRQKGHLLLGGAILDGEGNPAGSAVIARFGTRAELDAWLADDPWAKGGLWSEVEIIPFRVAEHYAVGST